MNRRGGFRIIPPDGSRDPRIEDPTNRWIVHLIGRALLPLAVRLCISANAVSVAGFVLGAAGAWCFGHWQDAWLATAGLALCVAWMIADGLDGMIARATGTASALGRALDGLCDHGVFILLYVALALSIGTAAGWLLAVLAGIVHAVQASLYEGERMRFQRRLAGRSAPVRGVPSRNPLVRLYDAVAFSMDRWSMPFDRLFETHENPRVLSEAYGAVSVRVLKPMWILSNNMRVVAIYLACIIGRPTLFWWFELGPLTLVAVLGILGHRRLEARFVLDHANSVAFHPRTAFPAGSEVSPERSA